MANGNHTQSTIEAYEEYKRLTPDQREFQQFQKMHDVYLVTISLEKRYAKKWVERFATTIISLILISFLGALVTLVIPNTKF